MTPTPAAGPTTPAVTFSGGVNIAMKIPKADYEATVRFYRETLGLVVTEEADTGSPAVSRTHRVTFGPNTLWLDCVDRCTRSEVWLELRTDDVAAATARLAAAGVEPCDEIEPLDGDDNTSHWIRDPAGSVHLLVQP